MLAFAILIPSLQAQAADVPGFYQFGGRHLTFTGREDETSKGYRVYGYDCSVDLDEEFAEQFMNSLSNFRLVGHFVNDYRRGQAKLNESWVFEYTGSKRISKFELFNYADLHNPYYCHLNVSRRKDWNSEITHFAIRVAYGLTYGED